MPAHVLDDAIAAALTGRQAPLALELGRARRFHPDYGMFAAVPDWAEASLSDLSDLVARDGDVAVFTPEPPPAVPGVEQPLQGRIWQMAALRALDAPKPEFEVLRLGDEDAAEMLALATLTEPGPFFSRTHQLGDFVGVRRDGVLVAMAGERMQPNGFTEISAVCTHPDHRGRGYAAILSQIRANAIQARGETPFLHVFAHNAGAIAVYRRLGFELRREFVVTVLRSTRPGAAMAAAGAGVPGHRG